MGFTVFAGVGGIGFVLLALVVNVLYVRARLPQPAAGGSLDEVTATFAGIGDALRRPSVLVPVTWLCTTVFAAGLLAVLWRDGPSPWALVGFAGVLMQNVTFAVVEALRFGLASAARHGRGAVAGLWAFGNVLFGFNQVFLATALFGFTAAGVGAGVLPAWQAALGYVSGALLFASSAASPYNADGGRRLSVVGLVGWLGWVTWIVAYSVLLLRM